MAGPQFLTPKSVSPSRSRRRFTLKEANRALPLVQRIVADIVRVHERVGEIQVLTAGASAKAQQELQRELTNQMGHLQDYVGELTRIGCELKDLQSGLIDFVGRHQGHDIHLCWKLGEERIEYWHELHSGFAGRQPVSTLEETE